MWTELVNKKQKKQKTVNRKQETKRPLFEQLPNSKLALSEG